MKNRNCFLLLLLFFFIHNFILLSFDGCFYPDLYSAWRVVETFRAFQNKIIHQYPIILSLRICVVMLAIVFKTSCLLSFYYRKCILAKLSALLSS